MRHLGPTFCLSCDLLREFPLISQVTWEEVVGSDPGLNCGLTHLIVGKGLHVVVAGPGHTSRPACPQDSTICTSKVVVGGVTPKGSHLTDRDFGVDVAEVDHTGEGNSHVQESCQGERRTEFSKKWDASAPGASPVLKSSVHSNIQMDATNTIPILQKGKLRLGEGRELVKTTELLHRCEPRRPHTQLESGVHLLTSEPGRWEAD